MDSVSDLGFRSLLAVAEIRTINEIEPPSSATSPLSPGSFVPLPCQRARGRESGFGKEMNLNSENFNFLALFAGLENDDRENTFALLYSNIRFISTFVQLFDDFLEKAEGLAGFRTPHWGQKAMFARRVV